MIRYIKLFDCYALDLPEHTLHFWTLEEAKQALQNYGLN